MAEKIQHLIRIAKTDLNGKKQIVYALKKIKGVNISFANAICKVLGISPKQVVGALTKKQQQEIEELLKEPSKYTFPSWLLNRRKDLQSGKDLHIVTNQLYLTKDNDIKLLKKIRSYKGIRHALGLPLRGQRTRSNFRKNKGKVLGVKVSGGAKKRGRV